jgi:hypothetical protein
MSILVLLAKVGGCLLTLHTPDGGMLFLESPHVVAVRPASQVHVGNLAEGTRTVVYTSDENFGVVEEIEAVLKQLACN